MPDYEDTITARSKKQATIFFQDVLNWGSDSYWGYKEVYENVASDNEIARWMRRK